VEIDGEPIGTAAGIQYAAAIRDRVLPAPQPSRLPVTFSRPRRPCLDLNEVTSGQGHPLFQPNAGAGTDHCGSSGSAPQHQHAWERLPTILGPARSRLAQRLPLRDYQDIVQVIYRRSMRSDNQRTTNSSRPKMETRWRRSLRCAGSDSGCAVAGADAAGSSEPHIRVFAAKGR